MRQADVDEDVICTSTGELRELRGRNRWLKLENRVLRRVAAFLPQANLPGNGVGYSKYRDDHPKSVLDEVQYSAWTEGDDASPEQIAWDNELIPELRELVEPGDNEFFEKALQSAFIGTELPLELARKRIEVIVITGAHLDWCVERNARVAHDFGYAPIIIGDATRAETVEQGEAAFARINKYFAPVITSHQFVDYLTTGD